jgi:hypothetical protein
VVYKGRRVCQAGVAPRAAFGDADTIAAANSSDALHEALGSRRLIVGPICERCMKSGVSNYLANLALFPGRVEFQSYLPKNAQAVAVTPVGNEGVMGRGERHAARVHARRPGVDGGAGGETRRDALGGSEGVKVARYRVI